MDNLKKGSAEGHQGVKKSTLPKGWGYDYIENLAEITTGGRNTQDRVDNGLYPFFVRSQIIERINSFSFDGEAVLTAGDGVGTGKVFHYINGKFDAHQRVYRISNFKESLNGYFFYLYFSCHFYNRIVQMTAKSSVDSVRREMITRMLIPVPPRQEQNAIAKSLDDIKSLIDSLERLIAKKRNLKQAAMQELLTGKKRLLGFKQNWERKQLGDLGFFIKGCGVKKDESMSGALPCVRYGEIYTTHNYYVKSFYSWIAPHVAAEATRLKCGDILFAGSGETKEEIGKCVAFIDQIEAYAGGDVVILRPEGVDSLFLGYYLNTPHINRQKASKGQGDAVVHISAIALSAIPVTLPSQTEEQSAIAVVLKDMDVEIEQLENKLIKTRNLKQGMMQMLLTGKIRLS